MTPDATALEPEGIDDALAIVTTLAEEIGARRPTSRAERLAAEVVREALTVRGILASHEPFAGYASFGYPFGAITALSTAPVLLPSGWRRARGTLSALAAALLASEGSLVCTPLSDLLSRAEGGNVVGRIEPRGTVERTVCLVAHLDTSRSGLLFHPAAAGKLSRSLTVYSLATILLAAEPLLARTVVGRALVAGARTLCAAGLALIVERELRGVDVPGANDNASGVGVAVQLAAEVAARPLDSTRVVVLVTGCEEAGLLGARAFLREHDTAGWMFLNFDSVGGPATLRFMCAEGMVRRWPADAALIGLAERVRTERPELGLEPAHGPIGLTYDATAVLASGGRAITFVAGDQGLIPNYHQPSDTVANLDPETLACAAAAGRKIIALIDRGEAD